MNDGRGIKKDRKAQIVRATLKCIADLGYSKVTMQTISSCSGLSKGAIHHYFRTKEDILLAAFRELDLKLYDSVDSKLKNAKNTRAFLARRIEGPFELIKSDPSLFICLTEFLAISAGKEAYAQQMKEFFTKYRRLIRWGFDVGIKEGLYRHVSSKEASFILLALLLGIEIQLRVDREDLDLDKIVRMISEMLFGYIERPKTSLITNASSVPTCDK